MGAKFVIKQVKDGYRFVLKASNGETIASGESYKTAAGARRGAEACKRAAEAAEIVMEEGNAKASTGRVSAGA